MSLIINKLYAYTWPILIHRTPPMLTLRIRFFILNYWSTSHMNMQQLYGGLRLLKTIQIPPPPLSLSLSLSLSHKHTSKRGILYLSLHPVTAYSNYMWFYLAKRAAFFSSGKPCICYLHESKKKTASVTLLPHFYTIYIINYETSDGLTFWWLTFVFQSTNAVTCLNSKHLDFVKKKKCCENVKVYERCS